MSNQFYPGLTPAQVQQILETVKENAKNAPRAVDAAHSIDLASLMPIKRRVLSQSMRMTIADQMKREMLLQLLGTANLQQLPGPTANRKRSVA